ncbi:hypothetical protein H1S01_03385 [Heliobacterium chlorum]|uniref:Uncharacterized protein n=1 Tax=Heliobacterium chlorum TaxID=2698 RepID=A0ABR7SZX2_HELCL|nr:hypothetical protein [Heliobacterium chlorum]MBC9783555.1 hypothetical protein [Heliobacterium chlorum]
MLTPIQFEAVVKAVIYRCDRGENLDAVINSYTKLSPEDKALVYQEVITRRPDLLESN